MPVVYIRSEALRYHRLTAVVSSRIKPNYAEAILAGKKTIEFRKISFPKRVGTMVLYATSPVKKIVGVVKVGAVVVLSPAGAWRRYRKRGAIDRRDFNAYYAGSKKAVCLEIGEARRLDPPIDPHQIIEYFRAPQSFRYLPAACPFIFSRP